MNNELDTDRFSAKLDLGQSRHMFNILANFLLILLVMIYPLGIWLAFWSFSGIAMFTIIVAITFILFVSTSDTMSRNHVELSTIDIIIEVSNSKAILEKKISELSDKVNKQEELNENIEVLKESTKRHTEQLEKNILNKIDKSAEQLDTVIAEKTEVIKTALAWHVRTLDLDIKANKLEFKPLGVIIEQFEDLADKNEELYSMYEPIIDHVQDLTEHMEYGNLLSEQIRILMGKNTELISKNEELTQQVEQLLSYQRNEENK